MSYVLGVPSSLKLRSECNFCRLKGGRGWERGKAEASSSALLSKNGVWMKGSIESQQKFDFFCSDIMPKVLGTLFDCPYSYFMLLLENYYPLMEGLNPPGTPPPTKPTF